jgi:hypothetical protein
MVLSADFTDRALLASRLRPMLVAERRLTARPGWRSLTDDYNLKGTPGLRHAEANAERLFFNSAEYVKDGLLALTEWLGPSPWSEADVRADRRLLRPGRGRDAVRPRAGQGAPTRRSAWR